MSNILFITNWVMAIGWGLFFFAVYLTVSTNCSSDFVANLGTFSIMIILYAAIFGYGVACSLTPVEEGETFSVLVPQEMASSQSYVFARIQDYTLESDNREFVEAFRDKKLAVRFFHQKNSYGLGCCDGKSFVVTNLTQNGQTLEKI